MMVCNVIIDKLVQGLRLFLSQISSSPSRRFPKRGSVASHFGVSVACKDFRFPKTDFRFLTRVARNSGNNDQASVEGKFFSRICISTWLEIAANVNEQQLSRERVKIFLHAYAGIGKPAYYFMKDLHR